MNTTELKMRFTQLYGEGEVRFFAAAGRVNLIGEHVDYCGGMCLPAALDFNCTVAARKNTSNVIRMAATTTPLTVTVDIGALESYKHLKWGSYQAGVAFVMKQAGFDIYGCDLLYDCTVPFGSGLSSSAAIEVATALTLSSFSAESGGKAATRQELALYSQQAENEYCGVSCGIMDQFASSLGKKDHAILLNCTDLSYEYVPIRLGDYELIIANTNKPHSLVTSAYNERRAECERSLSLFRSVRPDLTCLAALSPAEFEEAKGVLDAKLTSRARHVVYECERVRLTVKAMKEGDLAALGRLLNESHYSLRDLYEVTGRELDTLTELARNTSGCLGSRMTGGGFGGSTVSLVRKDKASEFIETVGAGYKKAIGYAASFYISTVGDGARELAAGV